MNLILPTAKARKHGIVFVLYVSCSKPNFFLLLPYPILADGCFFFNLLHSPTHIHPLTSGFLALPFWPRASHPVLVRTETFTMPHAKQTNKIHFVQNTPSSSLAIHQHFPPSPLRFVYYAILAQNLFNSISLISLLPAGPIHLLSSSSNIVLPSTRSWFNLAMLRCFFSDLFMKSGAGFCDFLSAFFCYFFMWLCLACTPHSCAHG